MNLTCVSKTPSIEDVEIASHDKVVVEDICGLVSFETIHETNEHLIEELHESECHEQVLGSRIEEDHFEHDKRKKPRKYGSLSSMVMVLCDISNQMSSIPPHANEPIQMSFRPSRPIKQPSRFDDDIHNLDKHVKKVFASELTKKNLEKTALRAMELHDVNEMYGRLWPTIRKLKGSNKKHFKHCSGEDKNEDLLSNYVQWVFDVKDLEK
ncbi:hypothetical protein L7F22_016073 [Adiantum nelumboides]|nr:hypothetical protein [Adiantum nelumboides]